MKLLKPGFIQKAFVLFLLLIQVAGIVGLIALFVLDVFEGAEGSVIAIVVGLTFLIDVFTSLYVVNTNVADLYKVSWLVVIIALPVLGVVLYLVFANKTMSPRLAKKYRRFSRMFNNTASDPKVFESLRASCPEASKISAYLEKTNCSGVFANTSVQYFPLGDDAFPVMIQELEKAKHYIFFEYFIIENGRFFDTILEVLARKAKEGVDVRMMYDDVGCLSTVPYRYYKKIRKMGIKCNPFNKLRPLTDVRLNNRDHRKILVIDGHTGFTGGINIADEYINEKVRFGHWKDNAVMLKGEGVYGLTILFLTNWFASFDHRGKIEGDDYLPSKYASEVPPVEAKGYVQPYGDIPFDDEATGYEVYFSIISQAKRYVDITTPYLMIDKGLETALCMASKQGVEIRILTPHIPDKKMVFQMTRSYYGPLLKAGCKVYEYTPGFVHEKVFISDDKIATVGTINLDSRSLYLHLECGTFMAETPVIADMKKDFEATIERSEEITLDKWEKWHKKHKLGWGLLRVLAPFL
ncbi:MAG: cardiolipin synthase [Bacilli bacterium]|nr:cardiolipin synthase [Bacilli bacterium]